MRVERVSALLGEGIDRGVDGRRGAPGDVEPRAASSARGAPTRRATGCGRRSTTACSTRSRADPAVAAEMHALEDDVRAGTISPTAAAQRILRRLPQLTRRRFSRRSGGGLPGSGGWARRRISRASATRSAADAAGAGVELPGLAGGAATVEQAELGRLGRGVRSGLRLELGFGPPAGWLLVMD